MTCPHCGASVPAGALACPACGSDRETGWAEDAQDMFYEDLPGLEGEDDFDEEAFAAREFDRPAGPRLQDALLIGALLIVVVVWLLRG